MRFAALALALCSLTACDYTEIERETGYKGKARVNPWLAAERFIEQSGGHVLPVISWTEPGVDESVWMIPSSVLDNESFIRRIGQWVGMGGHLILLVENTDAATNDWMGRHLPPVIAPALRSLLERAGIILETTGGAHAGSIHYNGTSYRVQADSRAAVSSGGRDGGVFVSEKSGAGRITVITDARIFRNRWIDEQEHAALLAALVDSGGFIGTVGIMRGAGLSFWKMLREHLAPVLLGMAAWLLLWLWRNMSRFGPIEQETPAAASHGYEHHLEALGHFHWKLDHGAALIAPLRERVAESAHRVFVSSGSAGGDPQRFLAERAGLPAGRVARALSQQAPGDANTLAVVTADLQQMQQALHQSSMP
jgi:hypothetical protein